MDLIYALFRKHTTSSTKSLQNYEWYAKMVNYFFIDLWYLV